jgi:diguanylate cyclase (GGDEF)-like protein
LGLERTETLEAALPAVALLMERRLDLRRRERQRSQLSALANIARVISQEDDLESVLASIAGSIALVANMDLVTIDVVDASGRLQARAMNTLRPEADDLREHYRAGAMEPAPVRDAVLMTRSPMIFANAQEDERIPEDTRRLFAQTRIRSCAMFPLLAKGEVLGTLGMATHRRLNFERRGVDALEALVAQVAVAIKGIQLYGELNESREELQRLNQQLQESMGIEHHLARTDALTGIPNRRFIDETIAMELSRANRYGQDLAIVMADLDDLKEINDSYGHEAGDGILRFVAEVARQSCRQVDVVGRYGGDEFVFVLPSTKADEAALFAERFRQQLTTRPAPVPASEPLHLTVSLGVAYWDRESMADPAALIRQADRAMYKAKSTGRNRTVVAGTESVNAA